jgi:uncharacterized damage-inducible protein DinB
MTTRFFNEPIVINPADQFRRLFDYEAEAHRKTFHSLRVADSVHRDTPELQKAVDLAAHIVTCRDMWLRRISGCATLPPTLFPAGLTLSAVEGEFARVEAEWRQYLDSLEADELSREFEYVSYEGGVFRSAVNDVLIQLFGHSLYHRGQIALLLRQIDATPAATDFVFWSRRPAG